MIARIDREDRPTGDATGGRASAMGANDEPEGGTPRVLRLPDALVDQIAAGEVVERPASVVKELVENALDAGASRLRIDIRAGGAALVAVSDDGRGMTPEDARLALERHATSKITSAEDLARIVTFGFRGEALPAIASVSRLRLRTRARAAADGLEIEIEGSKRIGERTAGGPEGTRIEVADLFYNVPARRKFLKTAATEWSHVAEWLARSALALPTVHFDVRRDDREAVHWPAVTDPLDRIAAVLSERDAEGLVPVAGEDGALRLEGFASRPDAHRPTAAGLHLFVQRRPVRDRLLRHALLDAYRDVLPRGRFPSAVLFLDLPPHAVDVNVHPAKWEVRFADPGAVHRLVARSVRDALGARRWLGTAAETTPTPDPQRPAGPGAAEIIREGPRSARGGGGVTTADWVFTAGAAAATSAANSSGQGASGHYANGVGPPLATPGADAAPGLRFAALRPLGQLLATYLLLEASDGLVLVDQHAAHERVLYERLRASWRSGSVARQPLLLPVPVDLAPDQAARLAEAGSALERLGFEVEPFGADVLAVRAIPAELAGHDPAALLANLADRLGPDAGALPAPDAADRLFASLACHAARRAGERLDPREQQALLAALDAIPWAATCPHGRPVAIPVSRSEIERRFGRA
jgi:DNA mismatch repair protein MutL